MYFNKKLHYDWSEPFHKSGGAGGWRNQAALPMLAIEESICIFKPANSPHFQSGAHNTIRPHQEKAELLQKTLRLCEEDRIEMDGWAALGCFVSFTVKASGERNSITPGERM
jgi:hypothetical protein